MSIQCVLSITHHHHKLLRRNNKEVKYFKHIALLGDGCVGCDAMFSRRYYRRFGKTFFQHTGRANGGNM
jgi:hypothetical protein